MKNEATNDVPWCTGGNHLTISSNYLQKNCVTRCLGFAQVGQPAPITFVPCFSDASGCCIQTTSWCKTPLPGGGSHVIEISAHTTTVSGKCTGDITGVCNNSGLGLGKVCIENRCLINP